jgi:hypothetical protein
MGYITRAIVLQIYYADDPYYSQMGWAASETIKGITCDVRTYGKRQRIFRRVPVAQFAHGMHDENTFKPRPSRINITGGSIVAEPSATGQPLTPAENLDGDHVLLTFLEGDPSQPIILPFVLPHPNSARRHLSADGRNKRIRHNGVSIEWDDDGNLTIDATETANANLATDGSEQSNVGTGGNILIKTKATGDKLLSVKLTSNGQIHLGSDPETAPTSPIVCGTEWISIMGQLLDAILALTVGTGVGPSTPPINSATFTAIKNSINANDQVSDFIFTKKSLD